LFDSNAFFNGLEKNILHKCAWSHLRLPIYCFSYCFCGRWAQIEIYASL